MPRVSVLMSVYNGIEHFDKAIPSLLQQTLQDFELLIVDDCSDDGTSEKLDEVAAQDARIKVLHSESRLGLARAVNWALRLSKGQYVARQDFDDESYPQRLEKQAEFLETHPEVGLVGSYYVIDDRRRNERYIRKWPIEDAKIRNTMAKAIPFAHTLVMLRKEALEQAGGIAEVSNITDLRTWIQVGKVGWKFANIPEVLGVHYVYEESFWHRTFSYKQRQRELAKVQAEAVLTLHLGLWRLIFPFARLFYSLFPDSVKRSIRRVLAGSKEEDISHHEVNN